MKFILPVLLLLSIQNAFAVQCVTISKPNCYNGRDKVSSGSIKEYHYANCTAEVTIFRDDNSILNKTIEGRRISTSYFVSTILLTQEAKENLNQKLIQYQVYKKCENQYGNN